MATKKPNILIIWGDDIGWFNVSAYNHGIMGYKTPNIDRIAKEGALFTDWYGQQSCTAGRAAFITGQSPIRTGLTKVGLARSETRPATGRPDHRRTAQAAGIRLRTVRQEPPRRPRRISAHRARLRRVLRQSLSPERRGRTGMRGLSGSVRDFPEFAKKFGPRGVLHCFANPDGTQKIEDTGHLTKKRMETMDEEITAGRIDFIERQVKADKPFFCWWNSTKMHILTHLKDECKGKTGLGIYADGMVEHDRQVGQLLDKLDELGIADNTIVMYSTDNGAEELSWPDGGTTPFRGEKDTNWDGGWRVPTAIRWPGVIKPGTVSNEIFSHQDMLPTLLAAAGEPDIVEK